MADDIIVEQPVVVEPTVSEQIAEQMAFSLGKAAIPSAVVEPTVITEPVVVVPPTFEIVKERFGYQNPEDAVKEIEELRALKANPPKAEIKFENEASKKLYEAWTSGDPAKQKEVKAYLLPPKMQRK